jgi:hypothetical protein
MIPNCARTRWRRAQSGGGFFLVRNSGGGVYHGGMLYEYLRAYMNDAAWIEPTPQKDCEQYISSSNFDRIVLSYMVIRFGGNRRQP